MAIEPLVTDDFKKNMIIKKFDIAKHLLDRAIEAFFNDDVITAIHLAGASEEILGKYCEYKGMERSFNILLSNAQSLNNELKYKEINDLLNETKNQLKHFRNANDDEVEILELDPYFLLVRAVINYMKIDNVPSPLIIKFTRWVHSNNADNTPEFSILLSGVKSLVLEDFVL